MIVPDKVRARCRVQLVPDNVRGLCRRPGFGRVRVVEFSYNTKQIVLKRQCYSKYCQRTCTNTIAFGRACDIVKRPTKSVKVVINDVIPWFICIANLFCIKCHTGICETGNSGVMLQDWKTQNRGMKKRRTMTATVCQWTSEERITLNEK